MKIASVTILILCVLCLLAVYTTMIVKDIIYTRNCGGYLKQAADANTIELAAKRLEIAIKWLEKNNIKSGYTSVLWRTPDEDIGFWYGNLHASLAELKSVKSDATQLEKSNVLMKLRETLLNGSKEGDKITAPEGISKYPNNKFYFWIQILLWVVLCVFVILVCAAFDVD